MGTTIITKNGSGAPAADDLVAGELAVDLTNKRLYTKDSGNNVLELGSSPSTIVFSSVASNITPSADDTYDLGATGTKWRDIYIDGTAYLDAINFNGTAITATAAELNILDGVTSTAAELNILDGVTSTAAELNILDGVTATTAELNILDGVTSTTAELNILDGVTSTTAELNILDGVTATATELNYVDGVTSAIQTQLDAKAPTASPTLTGTITAADLIISNRQIATDDASGTNTAGNNVTLKAGSSTGSAAGGSLIFQTTPAGSTGTLVNSFSTVMTLDESGIDVAGAVEFDSLSGTGSVSVTDILDQDDMSSDSATALATQQSIKAYVDSQIGSNNELSEVLAIGNTTGSTNIVVTAGQSITTDTIAETTAAAGVTVDSLLIKDGGITAAGTSTFSGQTISDLGTVTTANIDGGSIDGTTIGASTAAAGTFTTGQFDTSLNVDGTVTADGLTVDGSGGFGLTAPTISEGFQIHVDEAGNGVWGGFGNVYLTSNYKFNSTNKFAGTGYAQILEAVPSTGAFTFKTSSASGTADATATMQNRLNIATNGDISFYEDTGTTAKFFWDASAESLGIGTTTPASNTVHIASATNTTALKIQNSATSGRTYQLMAHGGGSSLAGKFSVYDETAGIHRIALDSSGNVGIGTTSPTADLSVGSTTTSSGDIHLRTTKTAAEITPSNTDAGGLDIDVGWVSGGQGPLTFSLSGSEKMRIDASGNVGIGESDPGGYWAQADNLVVGGTGNDGITIKSTTSGNGRLVFTDTKSSTAGLNDGGMVTYNHPNDDMTFRTAGTDRVTIDSSGNVGIGTTTPAQPIEILKTSAAAVVPMIQLRNGSSTAGSGTSIKFMHSTVSNATSGTCELESIRYSGNLGALTFKTSNNGGTVTERMRIDDTGVGIGTSSPSAKLDIFDSGAGNANSAAIELTNYDYGVGETGQSVSIEALVRNDGGGSSTTGKIVFGKDSDYSSAANRDGNIQFYTNQSNSVTEAMRIDSSGNLLVGTTTTTAGNEGMVYFNGSSLRVTRDSDEPLNLDRLTTDGSIIDFKKDGATVGSITANSGSGGFLGIKAGGSNELLLPLNSTPPRIQPSVDDSFDIGTASAQFKNFYLSGEIYNPAAYNQTTGLSANMYVNSAGRFFRSTSSERYKNTIQNATHGLTELLTLRPVTYKGNDDGDVVFGGLIAEEVHDAGLTEFVQYNEENQPDALAYGNMVSLCIKAIQEQQDLIESLTARIAALEGAN